MFKKFNNFVKKTKATYLHTSHTYLYFLYVLFWFYGWKFCFLLYLFGFCSAFFCSFFSPNTWCLFIPHFDILVKFLCSLLIPCRCSLLRSTLSCQVVQMFFFVCLFCYFNWALFLGVCFLTICFIFGVLKEILCFTICLSVSLTLTGTDNLLLLNIVQEIKKNPKKVCSARKTGS